MPSKTVVIDADTTVCITEAERLELNTKKAIIRGAPPADEAEHYYCCSGCGQAVYMRLLGNVLYHDQDEHSPLPTH